MNILVTGGCGYIGSHTVLCLLEEGYNPVVVDNLSNSKYECLLRVEKITGKKIKFYNIDICNATLLCDIFKKYTFDAVIHFAGYKSVGESVALPDKYYENNIISTLSLIKVMKLFKCHNLVFSSSATVYGTPKSLPIPETAPIGGVTNAYGRTKLFIEEILQDIQSAYPEWNIALLRYFNPAGAHPSGLIGEDPQGIPSNLVPYISQVAAGGREFLSIFGGDYPTLDGTGVRDYIHVMDLAKGHIAALRKLEQHSGLCIYNLGTGKGYSVLEMVHAFEKACGHSINYKIVDRRPGDVASCYADPTKAELELNWKAGLGLDVMMHDAWNWQKNNPNGFST